jgi:hypothetical protein
VENDGKDDTPLTGATLLRRPRNLAVLAFFYVILMLFQVCLMSMIKINAATVTNVEFHWRAMELLYVTRALLNFKDR